MLITSNHVVAQEGRSIEACDKERAAVFSEWAICCLIRRFIHSALCDNPFGIWFVSRYIAVLWRNEVL